MMKHVRRLLAELMAGLERFLGVPMVGAADGGWSGSTPVTTATPPWRRER